MWVSHPWYGCWGFTSITSVTGLCINLLCSLRQFLQLLFRGAGQNRKLSFHHFQHEHSQIGVIHKEGCFWCCWMQGCFSTLRDTMSVTVLQACLWEEVVQVSVSRLFMLGKLYSQGMGGGDQRISHSKAATFPILKTVIYFNEFVFL